GAGPAIDGHAGVGLAARPGHARKANRRSGRVHRLEGASCPERRFCSASASPRSAGDACMISTATGRGKLYGVLKDLRFKWDELESKWDDPVRKDFEEQVWEPLVAQSQNAIRAMDRLSQIMMQMQNECQ